MESKDYVLVDKSCLPSVRLQRKMCRGKIGTTKGLTMTNDELTMNQKLWLCMTITDKCPYCNETIEIHPEDMGANLRSGNYMCRCPKCDKVIEIIISTSFQKRKNND